MVEILEGDALTTLQTLPDKSAQMCVTSPPYFGLRDYGVEGQMGLEATPEAYCAAMVAVFREVRRVLKDDGTLWLNIGDSYAASGRGGNPPESVHQKQKTNRGSVLPAGLHETARVEGAVGRAWVKPPPGYKHKDLIGIPWMLAFALRADGWYLRSDIIWHKPNPMPESVTDRPTKSHEYLFLFAKSERYFYDHEAIKEPANRGAAGSEFHTGKTGEHQLGRASTVTRSGNKERKPASARGVPVDTNGASNGSVAGSVPWEGDTRNKRTVWTIATQPFSGAHFATFPPSNLQTLCRRCNREKGASWR